MGQIVTTSGLAEIFGKSRRTIGSWLPLGLPVHKRGGGRGKPDLYDSAEVIEWYVGQMVGNGTRDPELKQARLSILQSEAEIRKLKLKTRQGDLVERGRTFEILKNVFSALFSALRGMALKLSAIHGDTDPRKVRRMDDLLRDLSFSTWALFVDLMERETEVEGPEWDLIRKAWREAVPTTWTDWRDEQMGRPDGPELSGQDKGNGRGGDDDHAGR